MFGENLVTRRAVLSLLIALGCLNIPQVAHAQTDCNAVLVGIYDKQFVRSGSSQLSSVLDIVKKYNASSYQQAKSIAGDAGLALPIDGLPLQFQTGFKTDSSGQGNWVSQLDSYMETHTDSQQAYESSIETANAGVVKAWESCMVNRTGLIVSPDVGKDEQEIIVSVRFKQPTPSDKIPTLKIPDYDHSQLELLTATSLFVGKPAPSVQPLGIRFQRQSGFRGETTIGWFTSSSYYSATLRLSGIPQPAPSPPPRDPNIVDFDGDQLLDSFVPVPAQHGFLVHLGYGKDIPNYLISADFNPSLPDSPWIEGDFDGDGYTDLMYIVTAGVNKPGYGLVFYSKGDGTFDLFPPFDFVAHANSEGNYKVNGSWTAVRCPSGKWEAHHQPPPGQGDPKVPGGYYWIPDTRGQFHINSASCR